MFDYLDLLQLVLKLLIILLAVYCICALQKFKDHNPTLSLNYVLLYLDISMIVSHLIHDTAARLAERDLFTGIAFRVIEVIMFTRFFGQFYFLMLLSVFLILACYWPNTYRLMRRRHTFSVLCIPAIVTITHVTVFLWGCDCMSYRIDEYMWEADIPIDKYSPKMIHLFLTEGLKLLCLISVVTTDIFLLIKLYRHGLYRGPKYSRSQPITDQQALVGSNLINSNNANSQSNGGISAEVVRRRPQKLRIDARLALGFTYLCVAFFCHSACYIYLALYKNEIRHVIYKTLYHVVGYMELSKCSMYILIVTKR